MSHRGSIGLFLGLALAAGQPAPSSGPHAWVLALDATGGVVTDLKPAEFQVKVQGKACPVVGVKSPAETATAAQSWILVFEPIRDLAHRALAFAAAADVLVKVPQGDRVLIVARGKDSLESLMPGLSVNRTAWAEALAKVPAMLPESLTGMPKEAVQGAGFQIGFKDAPDDARGQDALLALQSRFTVNAPAWAGGTNEQRGISVLARLNFNDPMFVRQQVAAIKREMATLESLFGQLGSVDGQKHVLVFSRDEADDMSHPGVKRAMSQSFRRERGDAGGPAESATYATGEMALLQEEVKAKAVAAGLTLYSVAGAGQNVLGLVGAIAPGTGGFSFPLAPGVEGRLGQSLQAFGSRYLVQWQPDAAGNQPVGLEISTSRKGLKILAQDLR